MHHLSGVSIQLGMQISRSRLLSSAICNLSSFVALLDILEISPSNQLSQVYFRIFTSHLTLQAKILLFRVGQYGQEDPLCDFHQFGVNVSRSQILSEHHDFRDISFGESRCTSLPTAKDKCYLKFVSSAPCIHSQ
jgi:hypothetical protein